MARSTANDLLERENQAGNAEDSLSVGQKNYDTQFNPLNSSDMQDFDAEMDAKYGEGGSLGSQKRTDSHGDTVLSNYNADEPDSNIKDLKDKEEVGGPSSYKPGNIQQKGRLSRIKGFIQKKGPATGVVGLLLGGMASFTVLLSPGALFIAIEKSLTNDGSDSARTNIMMRRAYIGSMLGKSDCSGSKIKCKLTTMSKGQLEKWKQMGFKVNGTTADKNGNSLGGNAKELVGDDLDDSKRAQVTSITYPDGTETKSGGEFDKKAEGSLESRRLVNKVLNNRSAFFQNSKFNKVISKWGLKKSSTAKKTSNTSKDKAEALVEEERKKSGTKFGDFAGKLGKSMSVTTAPASAACAIYNTTRFTIGAVKAKWVADIVNFAWPFVVIASKQIEGDMSDEDTARMYELADNLTWYQRADTAKTPEEKEKINLSATDSQGLRMAMYGDTTKLKEFTETYTTGGLVALSAVSNALGYVQEKLGKNNIRTFCINAARAGAAGGVAELVACIAGSVLTLGAAAVVCAVKVGATMAAYIAAIMIASEIIKTQLVKALSNADINPNLKGVDAGNALAAGIGLMLSHSSRGYGMKPATSVSGVKNFITATDTKYYQYGEELARYEAKSTPFDITNQYSFLGSVAYSVNPYMAGTKTGFSQLANTFALLTTPFSMLSTSVSALHSQPSLMTNNDQNLNARLNNGTCRDTEMQDIGLMCDWSGRMVGVTSPRVLQWTEDTATGKHNYLLDTIDFMKSEHKGNNEGLQEGTGTRDETCDDGDNFLEGAIGNGCRDSEQASIDDEGNIIEDSQYSKYKQYCSEERKLEPGSAEENVESGSSKDEDWRTMKQCAKDSLMMDHFAFYFNMCESQAATADGINDTKAGCASEETAEVTGTPNASACDLLKNPNVVLIAEGTKVGLKKICETGHATNSCGNDFTINPILIGVISQLSSKYKVWINNFGFMEDRYSCDSGQHPKGNAIDLNGIQSLSGSGKAGGDGGWGGITYSADQLPVVQSYANDWLAALPRNRGGVGQSGCNGFNITPPPGSQAVNGSLFFSDSCDHLHIDVRDRNNLNGI